MLAISQAHAIENPLCAVSQRHEEELRESLESNRYWCSAELSIVASPVSERFGAVEVTELLEQRGTDLFLRKEFGFATVDGFQRPSRIRKPADYDEARTDWASQPIRMTFMETLGFWSLPLISY